MIFWPVLQQRLVELLPTLPGYEGVKVHDGPPLSDTDARSYVTVGWSEAGDVGSWSQDVDAVDTFWSETGTVVCEWVVWGGDETLAAYRATAFDLVNALDEARRTDPLLGVLPPASTTNLSADMSSAQDSTGATQRLVVSVNYFVRS